MTCRLKLRAAGDGRLTFFQEAAEGHTLPRNSLWLTHFADGVCAMIVDQGHLRRDADGMRDPKANNRDRSFHGKHPLAVLPPDLRGVALAVVLPECRGKSLKVKNEP
jgi:hypothetical protein